MSPEHVQVWRFHSLCATSSSGWPPSWYFFFLRSNWNFLFPKLCLSPLVTSQCTAKSVLCVPYILALGILQTAIRSPLSLHFWRLNRSISPLLRRPQSLTISWLSTGLAPKCWRHSCPGSRLNSHLSVTFPLISLFLLCCWSLCSWKLLDALYHISSI